MGAAAGSLPVEQLDESDSEEDEDQENHQGATRSGGSSGSSSGPRGRSQPHRHDVALPQTEGGACTDHPLRMLAHAIMAQSLERQEQGALSPMLRPVIAPALGVAAELGMPPVRSGPWNGGIPLAGDFADLFSRLSGMTEDPSAQEWLDTVTMSRRAVRPWHPGGASSSSDTFADGTQREIESDDGTERQAPPCAAAECHDVGRLPSAATLPTVSSSSLMSSGESSARSSATWTSFTPSSHPGSSSSAAVDLPVAEVSNWELEFLLRAALDERPPGASPPTSQEVEFALRMALDEVGEKLQEGSPEEAAKLVEEAEKQLAAWMGSEPKAREATQRPRPAG